MAGVPELVVNSTHSRIALIVVAERYTNAQVARVCVQDLLGEKAEPSAAQPRIDAGVHNVHLVDIRYGERNGRVESQRVVYEPVS